MALGRAAVAEPGVDASSKIARNTAALFHFHVEDYWTMLPLAVKTPNGPQLDDSSKNIAELLREL